MSTTATADMRKLLKMMLRVMKPEHVYGWLDVPNLSLGSRAPFDVIEAGEIDRVFQLLYELDAGIPE